MEKSIKVNSRKATSKIRDVALTVLCRGLGTNITTLRFSFEGPGMAFSPPALIGYGFTGEEERSAVSQRSERSSRC